jgi:selenoprotein W-related protein
MAGIDDDRCVIIEYCVRCRWLLRAAWLAQELLSTFENELSGVTLRPSQEAGVLRISVAGAVLWSRQSGGRFPEPKEIKQLVRDAVCPGKDLGHAERAAP